MNKEKIKERYFRVVIAYPEGAVVHHGDCTYYSENHICSCGLHHDLMPLSDKLISELYPKLYEEQSKYGTAKDEYMHESIARDAVEYDMDTEDIIMALCYDNVQLQAEIKELKISESDSNEKAKEYFSLAANEKETLRIARETIMSIQAELNKHRKAVKIALDFISPEGDCVEQSKRLEIEQALKGD